MKNWTKYSILFSLVIIGVGYFYTSSLILSCLSGLVALFILIYFNPSKRYMRAFYTILAVFISLNKVFFEITGSLLNTEFTLMSNTIHPITNSLLIFAGITCLILDFFENNEIGFAKNKEIALSVYLIKCYKVFKPSLGENSIIICNMKITNSNSSATTISAKMIIKYKDEKPDFIIKHKKENALLIEDIDLDIYANSTRIKAKGMNYGYFTFKVPNKSFDGRIDRYNIIVENQNGIEVDVDSYIISDYVQNYGV